MKKQFGVYVGGEFERTIHLSRVQELMMNWADRPATPKELKDLQNGKGLDVDALISLK